MAAQSVLQGLGGCTLRFLIQKLAWALRTGHRTTA